MSKCRISKEKFVKIIEMLKKQEHTLDAINGAVRETDYAVGDVCLYFSNNGDTVLELLGIACGLDPEDDLLTWWAYEKDFGDAFEIGDVEEESEGDEWRTPDLSTIDGLWEYVQHLAEQYDGEE